VDAADLKAYGGEVVPVEGRASSLRDLLEHFSRRPLSRTATQSDILRDACEFLIKKFADLTNNKAGEFREG
jgi:type I restriction-modification system DNA methylase subunit